MKMLGGKVLLWLSVFYCYHIRYHCCQVFYTLDKTRYNLHQVVDLSGIGEHGKNTNYFGLGCRLTSTMCRGNNNQCLGVTGNWYFPDGSVVSKDNSNDYFVKEFGNKGLFLYRRHGVTSDDSEVTGVWKCEIDNDQVDPQIGYVGLYWPGSGILNTHQEFIHFSEVLSDKSLPKFKLTLTTSGGPASIVTWKRKSVNMRMAEIIGVDNSSYSSSQTIMNRQTAEYINSLTVTGRHPAMYIINVDNRRTDPVIERNVTILDSLSPTNIILTRIGFNSVQVSWSAPNVSPGLTGYRVTNMNCTRQMPSSECEVTCTQGNTNCIEEVDNMTTFVDYNNIDLRTVHDISITVSSIHVDGINPEPGYYYLPSLSLDSSRLFRGVQIDNFSLSTQSLTSTSVSVLWSSFDQGLTLSETNQYSVHIHHIRFNGDCSTIHGTENVNKTSDSPNSVMLRGLEEFSTYNVTITAQDSESDVYGLLEFTTYSAAPSERPQSLTIMDMTTTSITITWENIECSKRNGMITHYIVRFGPVSQRDTIETVRNVSTDEGRLLTVTDIDIVPYKQYFFEVAAVNSNGTGPNASVFTVEDINPVSNISLQQLTINLSTVNVSWTHSNQGLSADQYIVSYRRINGTNGQCDTYEHEDTLMVDGSNWTTIEFQEYSEYELTVIARNNPYNTSSQAEKKMHTTLPSVPSGPPRNLTITNMTTTSITITWESVECIHRNGLITNYIIRYRPTAAGRNSEMEITTNPSSDGGGSFTIEQNSSLPYDFRVAAINSEGMGKYAYLTMDQNGKTEMNNTTRGKTPSSVTAIIGGAVTALALIALLSFILIIVGGLTYFRRRATISKERTSTGNRGGVFEMSSVEMESEIKPYVYEPTLDLQIEAAIKEFPDNIQVIAGQEVTLKVVISGHPKPSLTWYHNGEELVADYSLEINQDGRVYIPSSELRHSGVYKLVVKNDRGSDEREMNLYIQHEYERISQKDVDITPIPVSEFGAFVAKHHENMNKAFTDLFQSLYEGEDHTKNIGLSPANKKLNRFGNITVYDDNRIPLKPDTKFVNTFINACYMDGYLCPKKYIATQGPLPKTVNDFWRLVWQEKVPTIVMVTNLKENNKEKCQQYWPDSGSLVFGPVEVTVTEKQILADYVIRTFLINLVDNEDHSQTQKVVQYHFTSWPDHGVPAYATSVLAYHRRIKAEHKPRVKRGPMLVHCSAGVGRTGTFIAIDWVLEQVEKEKIVDIAGTINKLRQQRMKMVQTVEQLVFIHDAILESVTCGNTQINVADLRSVVMKMLRRDPKTNKTAFELHWDVLEQVSPNPKQNYCSTAMKYPELNRKTEYLPSEKYRVVLKGEHPDYIHATNVNGYKQKNAYIIAEGPMESTLRNFWKMICGKKCGTIIMLSDLIENGEESCYKYWPNSSKEALRLKDRTVELVQEQVCNGYTVRKLRVTVTKKPPHEVMQFHITNWGVDGKCSAFSSVIEVIEEMTRVQMRSGNKPIVVHCSDTVGRSGMFCAISSAIEQCKSEGVIDVFQVIKAMRVQKPGAILNVQQYRLIFDAIMTYMDSFETYANFQNI